MRIVLSFFSIDDTDHPKDVVEELLRIHPAGAKFSTHSFYARMPENSPEAQSVLDVLGRAGLQPWVGRGRKQPHEYELRRYREYDDSDFEGLEFVTLWPEWYASGGSDTQGPIIKRGELKKGLHFARDLHGLVVMIPDRVKRSFESAEFRGLAFRPLRVVRNTANPDDDSTRPADTTPIGGPWWEIEPSFSLPPVSPFLTKVSGGDGSIQPRSALAAVIREPGFDDVELHYLRSELRAMPEFDVARSYELGPGGGIVASKRFYDYCKEHKLKCSFKPVRIDED